MIQLVSDALFLKLGLGVSASSILIILGCFAIMIIANTLSTSVRNAREVYLPIALIVTTFFLFATPLAPLPMDRLAEYFADNPYNDQQKCILNKLLVRAEETKTAKITYDHFAEVRSLCAFQVSQKHEMDKFKDLIENL